MLRIVGFHAVSYSFPLARFSHPVRQPQGCIFKKEERGREKKKGTVNLRWNISQVLVKNKREGGQYCEQLS